MVLNSSFQKHIFKNVFFQMESRKKLLFPPTNFCRSIVEANLDMSLQVLLRHNYTFFIRKLFMLLVLDFLNLFWPF